MNQGPRDETVIRTPDQRLRVFVSSTPGELAEQADLPLRGRGRREWLGRLQAEAGNLAVAVRWYLAHDRGLLPHLFRVLWLFWSRLDLEREAWPWVAQVRQRLGAARFDQVFAVGSGLSQRQAVAIVRDQRGTGTPAPRASDMGNAAEAAPRKVAWVIVRCPRR